MENTKRKPPGAHSPSDHRGHPQPRRTTPEKSVTLHHHRLARDASTRVASGTAPPTAGSPRRNSSDESQDTGPSDPKGWFDRSNRNPKATFDADAMDVDPPFFQKETDSSNEELRDLGTSLRDPSYPYGPGARQVPHLRPTATHSSSADDYRSVIDDLTIENKRLKEELKRYKQFGPDMMRKEKLFEIKVHGLPKRKKRELEATLREFAASLGGSSESPPERKKPSRHGENVYSSGASMSKHASSSSSRSRPVDSAYASMSAGPGSNAPNSSKVSLGRPSTGITSRKSTEQKVEDYLRDTPDGLLPRRRVMTDKEKKKLVVRRLEQLFTGKISGKAAARASLTQQTDAKSVPDVVLMAPPRNVEPAREAPIQPNDPSRKKTRSRDNMSTSNSNGDQTESGGNGRGSGDGGGGSGGVAVTGNNTSPPNVPPPEQRPTRPKDLDPDRVQVPSENMEYIRHLGLVDSSFLIDNKMSHQNLSPDADGWVYLNLLCNLAQLHMINVTPNFIRSAVSEKSAKFQLSPDGRKIRWRGGTDGTKFSSDSSGDNSQRSPSADETDGSDNGGQRKKAKTQASGGAMTSGTSSKESKFGPQVSVSSDSFQYKPMFVRKSSSEETSLEGTGSQGSDAAVEDSNLGHSKWDYSGSGSSLKKRRHDGAIVYYSGAPFCIDLSGDAGDVSPTTYLMSTGQEPECVEEEPRLLVHRTLSGSVLPIRPLSDSRSVVQAAVDDGLYSPPDLLQDNEDTLDDESIEFPWCDNPEEVQARPLESRLEPSGLSGILPEDHFAVIVTTRRTLKHPVLASRNRAFRSQSEESAEAVIARLASIRTSSPNSPRSSPGLENTIEIQYLKRDMRRLRPVSLPPPTLYFSSFSTDSDSDLAGEDMDSEDEDVSEEESMSEGLISQRANPHLSENTYPPDNDEMQSGESEDEDAAMEDDDGMSEASEQNKPQRPEVATSAGTGQQPGLLHTGSSVATAGGAESGYNSSMEDEA